MEYLTKKVDSKYYSTMNIVGTKNASRISVKKRKNKIIKLFDLDIKLEDETQGLIYAPYIPVQKYYVSSDPYTSGTEPSHIEVYMRIKKSEK